MAKSVLWGGPATSPAMYRFSARSDSFLGTRSFRGDAFAASLEEADGRVCASDSRTCPPSQDVAMNAVNKPTQTALQTFMVQTRAVHQPSIGAAYSRRATRVNSSGCDRMKMRIRNRSMDGRDQWTENEFATELPRAI